MAPSTSPLCLPGSHTPSDEAAIVALGVICGLLLIGIVFLLAGVAYLGARYREVEASAHQRIKAHRAMLVGYPGHRDRRNHEAMRGGDNEREGENANGGMDSVTKRVLRRHAPAPGKEYVVYPPDMARYISRRERPFPSSQLGNAKVPLANLRELDPRLAFPIQPHTTLSKVHRSREKEQLPTPAEEPESEDDQEDDDVSAMGPSDISSSLQGEVSEVSDISCAPEIVTRSGSKSARGAKRFRR